MNESHENGIAISWLYVFDEVGVQNLAMVHLLMDLNHNFEYLLNGYH